MMIMSKGDVIFVILLDVGIPSSESIAASNLSPSAVPNADPNAAPSWPESFSFLVLIRAIHQVLFLVSYLAFIREM